MASREAEIHQVALTLDSMLNELESTVSQLRAILTAPQTPAAPQTDGDSKEVPAP